MSLLLQRRQWLRLLGASGLAGPSLALTGLGLSRAWAGETKSTAGRLVVPPLRYTRRVLANGLTVLAQPGGGGGSVSVQVWYRVGGKDDPVGRSGFAHLFEHLMFKSTRYLKAEQFDRLTEDVGGMNNAFTAEDVTAYHSDVPSHHLERLLWAEAERMSGLTVDEANFKSERAVVQEEFRQRILAAPYGLLFNAVAPESFSVHPYQRPVIGSIEDLDAATLDDVRAFHRTYYRPDNAILVVSGDFDPDAFQRAVDRYFGPLTHPDTPIPRVTVKEPARREARERELTGPNVPLPAVMLLWQGPAASSPDSAALSVAQALLAGGDSSRLNESLVYRQQIAQSAGFEAMLYTDAGTLVAFAMAAGGRSTHSLVAPLKQEIARLAQGPLPAAELDKVKTQLLTAALQGRQTAQGRAMALGWAMIHDNDPETVNRELEELQAVTAADVQRVLKTYVLDKPAVSVHYRQEPNK